MPRTATPRWTVSFDASERLRAAERGKDEGGEPCSRGDFCSGRRIVLEDGQRRVIPASTHQVFCPACEGLIGGCLAELPPAYMRLGAELPQMHRRGTSGHSPFGPRLPFDVTYDELQRRIAETLLSWHERVATVARLAVVDTQDSRRRDTARAVTAAAAVLGAHLTALLALAPGPMVRSLPARSMPDDVTVLELSGEDAGHEILGLHRQALLVLGEIRKGRETLDGVPCTRCEQMSLERAEPPSDPAREAMWAECAACRHQMTRTQYEQWAQMYARWASNAGNLACRRCQLGRCAECQWDGCGCAGDGHSLAALCAA